MNAAVGESVVVDPVRCEGHGICALFLPARVDLDRWGYPVVDSTPVTTRAEKQQARRAARACPRRALLVKPVESRPTTAGGHTT
jgi:ferredoxin